MGEVIQFPAAQTEGIYALPLAVGSEFVVGQSCRLTLCPDITNDAREYAPEYIAFNADASPWLRGVRNRARQAGELLYGVRRQQIFDGSFDDIVLDVDAIGTAQKVTDIARMFGLSSPEHREAEQGLFVDCSRKIGEASRKNSWEYFKRTTQRYDAVSDQLYAHGMSVDAMIDNGISPVAEPEEVALRINDKVTHHTTKEIIKTPNAGTVATLRLAPCPEWAHESLRRNPKSAHGGYAPEIDKFMINFDTFDNVAQEVHHEQMAVAGTYITPEVMQEVLTSMQVVTRTAQMSRSEIHGTVGIIQNGGIDSVVDVIKQLDAAASIKSGKNIFIGEAVDEKHSKDYGVILEEAEQRRIEQESLALELAAYVEALHTRAVDHAVATQMVEKFIQEKLLDIVEKNPEQAEIIFNKETAERFTRASVLAKHGDHIAAEQLRAEARIEAPPSSSCGAGSCGLEGVEANSAEGLSLKKKLQAEDGDTIVKDKVRSCKSCGEKAIVYAYNKGKVNKACTNCNAFESKQTK